MTDRRPWLLLVGLAIATGIGVLLAPLSSDAPDGLEKTTADLSAPGHVAAEGVWQAAPAPGYRLPGDVDEPTSTRLAGLLGAVLVFVAVAGIGRVLRRPRQALKPRCNRGSPRS